MIDAGFRHEIKYICPSAMVPVLEARLGMICHLDVHSDCDGRYNISSLYFDSVTDECYFDCKNGVDNRSKYRIRIYNNSLDRITLEKKTGIHGKKRKDSVVLTGDSLADLLICKYDRSEYNSSVWREFCDKLDKGYNPKVVVAYSRRAFVYPIGNVRITFDSDIASLPDYAFGKNIQLTAVPVLPAGHTVLEVKYDEILPEAVRKLLSIRGLVSQSYSKYAMCREAMSGQLDYIVGEE